MLGGNAQKIRFRVTKSLGAKERGAREVAMALSAAGALFHLNSPLSAGVKWISFLLLAAELALEGVTTNVRRRTACLLK